MEFSQKITVFLVFFGVACIVCHIILLFQEKQIDSAFINTVIVQLIATQAGYMGYQGFIKNSRNKYRVDGEGVPFHNEHQTVPEL